MIELGVTLKLKQVFLCFYMFFDQKLWSGPDPNIHVVVRIIQNYHFFWRRLLGELKWAVLWTQKTNLYYNKQVESTDTHI